MNEHDFDNLPAYPGYQGHTEYLEDQIQDFFTIELVGANTGSDTPVMNELDDLDYLECAKALGLMVVS